jgi:uncharacterized protein
MFTALELSVPFGLGVISSLHCVQMCGPIVLAYSVGGRGTALSHLCYNGGRLMTYALLGAVAGAAGQAVGLMGRLAGFQHTAIIVSGILMIIAGVFMTGTVPTQRLVQLDRTGISKLFSRTAGKLMLAPGALNKLWLGLAMGFLPCGLLYAALLKAASTGSALSGAASMAAFAVGTAGALLGLGFFSSVVGFRLGRWSNAIASASVVLMGLVLVYRGWIARMPQMSCHAGM